MSDAIMTAWLELCQLENVAAQFPAYLPTMRAKEQALCAMLERAGGTVHVNGGRLVLSVETCTMDGKIIGRWVTAKGTIPEVARVVAPEHIAGFKHTWLHGTAIVAATADARPKAA
jgi:hypothetical protein